MVGMMVQWRIAAYRCIWREEGCRLVDADHEERNFGASAPRSFS